MEKPFDLEERTLLFARAVVDFCKQLPRTPANLECQRQLLRSAGSVGANYIEANEGLGRKDFILRIKTSKKEAKESRYWLQLVDVSEEQVSRRDQLIDESKQLVRIFASIVNKMNDS